MPEAVRLGVVGCRHVTARGSRCDRNAPTYEDKGDSGKAVYRQFCAHCGSPVLTDTPDAEAQGIIFFKAGTLDQTADLEPATHMWTKSAQHWVVFPEHHNTLPEQ